MNRGRVPLTLANETEEDIELEEGQLVALVSPVQEITELMAVDEYSPANENRASDEYNVPRADSPAPESKMVDAVGHRENDKPKVLPAHLTFLLDDSGSNLNGEEKRELEKLLIEFEDVFVGLDGKLGRTNLVTHSIDTGDAPPVRQRPRRVPYSQVEALDTEIENMLEQGIIRPSCSPYASPVVLVKKPSGKLRVCIDYRSLNSITKKDSFPLPRIDSTLDALVGSRFYNVMDLASGFFQVECDPEAKEKTAFCIPGALYEFNCMSMGLCNAPSTFSRLMAKVLQGMKPSEALVYTSKNPCSHGESTYVTE